jgi:hypothetical protein
MHDFNSQHSCLHVSVLFSAECVALALQHCASERRQRKAAGLKKKRFEQDSDGELMYELTNGRASEGMAVVCATTLDFGCGIVRVAPLAPVVAVPDAAAEVTAADRADVAAAAAAVADARRGDVALVCVAARGDVISAAAVDAVAACLTTVGAGFLGATLLFVVLSFDDDSVDVVVVAAILGNVVGYAIERTSHVSQQSVVKKRK